jgi:hypothetical protein
MTMDALTVTSLAGTIAQLVDFGCKVTSSSTQIYRSADGSAVSETELNKVAKDMERLLKNVDDQFEQRENKSGNKPDLSEDEVMEQMLAKECVTVIKELKSALEKVMRSGNTSKWRSFRQALLSIWHKEQIDGIEKRLCRFREQLTFRLVLSLRYVCRSLLLDFRTYLGVERI